jgi:hypothetical protein
MSPGAASDFPTAHLVCSKDAASIEVALANRTGGAASLTGFSASIATGAHLVASISVSPSGVTIVPAGHEGLVLIACKLPNPSVGTRELHFSIALTASDDPRLGIGAITIS